MTPKSVKIMMMMMMTMTKTNQFISNKSNDDDIDKEIIGTHDDQEKKSNILIA